MSATEYLHCTPPEINIKIDSWNDAKRYDADRDYRFIVTLLNGHNAPEKFPSFSRFYPEVLEEGEEPQVERYVSKAMETARALGDI
jgi:hypothetical protein